MASKSKGSSSSSFDMDDEEDTAPRRPSNRPRVSLNGSRAASSAQQRSSSRPDPSSSSDAPGPSSSSRQASSSHTNRSGMSTLARANARRVSMAPAGGLAAVPAPAQKLNVDSTSFEEWMKMATDNKINSTNTFSIALIDYFHDMSLLRSDSGDGTINFQKASCTLDGCVKVWTSRVDSVVSETGKLLNGLVGDGSKGSKAGEDDEEGDLDGEIDGEGAAGGGKGGRKKKTKAKEATLVKNFSAIAVKKLDLEYTVDPLFKKTSADFDEGGAGGLLMNHLGVDDKMRVVFDAGEAEGLPEGEEDDASDDEEGEDDEEEAAKKQAADTIDLSRMQAKLFSLAPLSLWASSADPIATLLNGRLVCPSLARFSFAPDQEGDLFGQADDDGGDDDANAHDDGTSPFDLGYMNPAITATPWGGDDDGPAFGYGDEDEDSNADLFGVPADLDRDGEVFGLPPERPAGMHSQMDEHDGGDGGGFDFMDGGGGDNDEPDMDMGNGEDGGAPVRWDPRQGPSQHDLLLAFKGVSGNDDEGREGGADGGAAGSGGLFDYFDQRLMKSWAGPEHWKMRSRLAGFGGLAQQQQQQQANAANGETGADGTPTGKKKRTAKDPFVIDFLNAEPPSSKELFEPPKTASSILLPKMRHQPEAFLLPEDRHFSSRMLLRLFSKPRAVLNIRTRRGGLRFGANPGLGGFGAGAGDGELDEAFWAQQQAAREAENGAGLDGGDGVDFALNDEAPMPLDTQFYHDGDDEGAFELASSLPPTQTNPNSAADVDVADFEEEDLAAQAAALKRVRPEYVNYAKKAKRVDVRRLKENIWKELAIEVGADTAALQDDGDETAESTATTTSAEPKTFRSVLSGLRKAYPKEKMDEISTSFCFICLLHLANEEGLEIKIGQRGQAAQEAAVRNAMLGAMTPGGRVIAEDEEDESEEDEDGLSVKGKLHGRRRVGDDSDDDDVEEAKSALTVGRLEYLRIKKDPKAGRSA
ncbi:barren-domain-containing protein [Jaminaea rosea]|uniref:Condensin complex subunit 2 n=1 Tax=Jaminaea rosea TaxID=1569628 RepID=A0A316UW38_9BASI|nr:barren-domain-containing protein [Jaminaea rosea]PWN29517.1 barren-domain-containing protein [Jaminaea rosea]